MKTKAQIVERLIEEKSITAEEVVILLNNNVQFPFGVPNLYVGGEPDKVPYGQLCPCNPANGGSGICGCTMGNKMIPNPKKSGGSINVNNFTTNISN